MLGLGLTTHARADLPGGLEGLCFQLRHALEMMSQCHGLSGAQGIRVVGGGARNRLWNQLRADVTGLPVTTIDCEEATVLGAAIFAFVGAGVFEGPSEGQAAVRLRETVIEPRPDADQYEALYRAFRALPPALEGFYRPH